MQARSGAYADSVALMQVSRTVTNSPGVHTALVAMATELNLGLLDGMGFTRPADVGPNDLLVAIRADDDAALAGGVALVAEALAARPTTTGGSFAELPPRTVSSAARATRPGARTDLRAGTACVHRGDGCPRRRLRRDDLLRQRAGRSGDPAQGRRGRARPAGPGTGLRHRRRGRYRARLRAHARARPGRPGRGVRYGSTAGAVPARRRRRRCQRRTGSRRPGPVVRRGGPFDARRARCTRRRSRDGARHRHLQASRRGRRRGRARLRRKPAHTGAVRADRRRAARSHRSHRGGTGRDRRGRAEVAALARTRHARRDPVRYAGCSPEARCATRRW